MPTVEAIRYRNARFLVEDAGGPAEFARALHMSDSQLAQYAGPRPRRPITSRMARRIELAAKKEPGWLDKNRELIPHETPFRLAYDETIIPSGFIAVPETRIVFAGEGQVMALEVDEPQEAWLIYRLSWFAARSIEPTKAIRFKVVTDKMEPTMAAGDRVLVDTGDSKIEDGKVYVIRYGTEPRIQRLSQRLDGTVILTSDNPRYPVEEVPPAMHNKIAVVGRVRHIFKDSGL